MIKKTVLSNLSRLIPCFAWYTLIHKKHGNTTVTKSPKKETALAKLKQYYGSKIVHMLQYNEIKKEFFKGKDAKTHKHPRLYTLIQGACPYTSSGSPQAGIWTPPMIAHMLGEQ